MEAARWRKHGLTIPSRTMKTEEGSTGGQELLGGVHQTGGSPLHREGKISAAKRKGKK